MDRMTNHTDDDKFDAWVPGAARDYNRPSGPAPSEAMWAAIEGALDATPQAGARDRSQAAPPAEPDGVSPIAPVAPAVAGGRAHGRHRLAPLWWQAAAALLLVATGIGIGRVWSARDASSNALTATAGAERAAGSGDRAARPTMAAVDRPASGPSVPASREAAGATPSRDGDAGRSYDVATMQHLSRAEALLTSFRADEGTSGAASMDRWARDLLADTRLFIDSPAGNDARSRQLLLDLELVLAQIVQLPAESSADRGLVQRSIERGAVLSRLRSTIPAGYSSGT
jgi:hypothetical protein